jgi:hypothetical protein
METFAQTLHHRHAHFKLRAGKVASRSFVTDMERLFGKPQVFPLLPSVGKAVADSDAEESPACEVPAGRSLQVT